MKEKERDRIEQRSYLEWQAKFCKELLMVLVAIEFVRCAMEAYRG